MVTIIKDDILHKRMEHISAFIRFEAETSIIWPWAAPADELLRSEDKLLALAGSLRFDADGSCDTEEIYEALDQAFGINPALLKAEQRREGMATLGM